MKKFSGLLLAILFLSAPFAQAAETRANRSDSLIFLGISPFGIHIPTLIAPPVGFGIYLGDNLLIGVESGSVSASGDSQDDAGTSTTNVSFDNTGAFVRLFPGTNSFNFFAAVHKREWAVDATATFIGIDQATGFFATVQASAALTASTTVGTLGIGNQWIMDFGLVLGMDWLLLSGPISSETTAVVNAVGTVGGFTQTLTAQQKAQGEKDLTKFADFLNDVSAIPGLFVFTIGLAF